MTLIRTFMLALLVALAAAGTAAAQQRDCGDDKGVDRCDPAQQARVRALFGVESIEAHRDAGDEVRRAFYVEGHGVDVIAIAFVRAPRRDPELRVHFRRVPGEPGIPPLVAAVPADQWQALIDRSAHFDRAVAPRPDRSDEGIIVLCVHPWVITVEASDAALDDTRPGDIRRRTENECEDGLAVAFAAELERAALALLPHCARLDAIEHRNIPMRLRDCRMLSGDRAVAADVLNRARALSTLSGPADLRRIDDLFSAYAAVEWNGERGPDRGSHVGVAFFLAKVGEGGRQYFYPESVEGERFDRVRLRGGLHRFVNGATDEPSRHDRAPVEMIWRSHQGREFIIESVLVGAYEPLP